MSGRTQIPVEIARVAFDQIGNWNKVAKILCRPDGSRFTAEAIQAAVRRADKNASRSNHLDKSKSVIFRP